MCCVGGVGTKRYKKVGVLPMRIINSNVKGLFFVFIYINFHFPVQNKNKVKVISILICSSLSQMEGYNFATQGFPEGE